MASWRAHAHVCEHALPLFLFTNLVWCSWNTSLSGTLKWQRTWIINHFISTNKIRCVLAIQANYVNTYWTCTNLKYRNHPNIMALYYEGEFVTACPKFYTENAALPTQWHWGLRKAFFKGTFRSSLSTWPPEDQWVFSRAQQPSRVLSPQPENDR